MNISAKTLKAINERLERIEAALELNDIGLPMKESEAAPGNNGLDAIFGEWEEKGIKSKLANIIVAPENVAKTVAGDIGTEYDGKMYFAWNGAMELERKVLKPNGWRLPTRSEWALLAEEFGQDKDGALDGGVLRESLKLPATGYLWGGGSSLYKPGAGSYWSRSSNGTDLAFALYFYSSDISPQDDFNKQIGLAVRCVKDIEEGKE